jgi:hypothetical protein
VLQAKLIQNRTPTSKTKRSTTKLLFHSFTLLKPTYCYEIKQTHLHCTSMIKTGSKQITGSSINTAEDRARHTCYVITLCACSFETLNSTSRIQTRTQTHAVLMQPVLCRRESPRSHQENYCATLKFDSDNYCEPTRCLRSSLLSVTSNSAVYDREMLTKLYTGNAVKHFDQSRMSTV